ncbi:MAG TPA: adenosylcobinamide-phosphate synthase CbiB [Terriglobia bacterium]|nr:adenosylcobinamide-phosphate synthase CbiB [Terriglobia bacterium]
MAAANDAVDELQWAASYGRMSFGGFIPSSKEGIVHIMIYATTMALIVGAALDLVLGDPPWLPHPIRGIGLLINSLERLLRKLPYEKAGGCVLVCAVLFIVVTVVTVTLRVGGFIAAAYWIFTCLAVRSLDRESNNVIQALRGGDLERGQMLVGHLVGRDTKHLSERDVIRAVFETVAENMNDAIVAPLFYLAVLGLPGMVAYKAVNTMDSMVGYKNDHYIRFGWAAARLDDVANYIPARITAGLIVLSAAVVRLRWRNAIHVVFRDARLQPSPNAGYPEAALAGALGVQLGGLNYYFGRPVEKPFLGDPLEGLEWTRFPQVRLLLYLVTTVSYSVVALWLL